MKIPNKKYIFYWAEENEPYYDADYLLDSYGKNSFELFGFGSEDIALIYQDYSLEFYLTEEEVRRSGENAIKFFSKKENVATFLENSHKRRQEANNFIRETLKKDVSAMSYEQFQDFTIEQGAILGNVTTNYSLTQPEKFKKIEKELLNYIADKGVKNPKEALQILVQADEEIEIIKEGKLFNSFNQTIKKDNYQGGKELLKNPYLMKKVDLAKRKKLIDKYKISKKIDALSYNLALLSIERMKMRFTWMKLAFFSNLILNEIEKRTGVKREDLRFYSSQEFINLGIKGEKISTKILREREQGIVKILHKGEIISLSPKESQEFIKKVRQKKKNVKEIKGSTASPGKAKGKVVILSFRNTDEHPAKIVNMQKGDIIVSEMTKPSIMIACEKAGAIVTDEGGILSHAAIVSRELGIPCVIGTGEATQVLKDGDIVEVDADRGFINILTNS